MRRMSMVSPCISRKYFAPVLFLPLIASCGQGVEVPKNYCESPHVEVIKSVLNDGEFRRYAEHYIAKDRGLIIVWDGMPGEKSNCSAKDIEFTLVKSSAVFRAKDKRYIIVSKMYYDDAAAFVEVVLSPTGMHGDFFLRNKARWNVEQRALWESKALNFGDDRREEGGEKAATTARGP